MKPCPKHLFRLLVGLLVWQGASAQAGKWGLPPSPNGKLASALLDAINEPDAEVHRKFVEEHFSPAFKDELPMETHLNLFQRMHRDLAGAKVAEANVMSRGGGDETVSLLLETKSGELFNVTFDVQLSSPPRLITLNVTQE